MKILFVTPYLPSIIRVRPFHFIRELSKRHEVAVLAVAAGREQKDLGALQRVSSRVEVVPFDLAASLRSCAAGALDGEPLQAAVCRSPELQRRLDGLLQSERFDVVHVEHLRAAHLGSRLPATLPTLFDAVDCISLLLARTLRSSPSLRQRLVAAVELQRTRAFEARVLGNFDRVTATSEVDAGALRALRPSVDVAVVPNGVDLDYFQPLEGAREPATLVFLGKMSYHANVAAVSYFVREVLPLVRADHPEVRLRIVGSNPPRAIEALARDPAISVTGYLPDIRDTLGRATVAICPITVKAGIQNKVLEAMAMGLPTVSTKAGVEGLSARPDEDVLVAEGADEFAGQVDRLLADANLRRQVGSAGRRYVEEHHRWDVAARDLEAHYIAAGAVSRPYHAGALNPASMLGSLG